jgi:hypothetical protein
MEGHTELWWWIVNVGAAASAPFWANLLLSGLERFGGTLKVDMWSAYRDGQLGFVALGWGAAGLYDISTHTSVWPNPNPGFVQAGLTIAIVFGALFAAAGARHQVKIPFVPQKSGFFAKASERFVYFLACSVTLIMATLALYLMWKVHHEIVAVEGR